MNLHITLQETSWEKYMELHKNNFYLDCLLVSLKHEFQFNWSIRSIETFRLKFC